MCLLLINACAQIFSRDNRQTVGQKQLMNNRKKISTIILAGGRGSRMGNIDKGLQHFRGAPLIEHCIARFETQTDEIIISSNSNLEQYQRYLLPIVPDKNTNFEGPLAGVLAAGELCQHSLIFVCPCDMPLLPDNIVLKMTERLTQDKSDICICYDGKRPQRLVMLLKVNTLESLPEFLAAGERKVGLWQNNWSVSELDCSDTEGSFININTLDELRQ